jgi:hypothetical protein
VRIPAIVNSQIAPWRRLSSRRLRRLKAEHVGSDARYGRRETSGSSM